MTRCRKRNRLRTASLVATMLVGSLVVGTGCGDEEEQGTSRLPPPASEIVYDAGNFDDVADGPMKHYLQAADALAHDRFDEAHEALVKLADLAQGELAALAQTAAVAQDLTSVRVAFKPLSQAVQTLPLPQGMAVAFCPMAFEYAGAQWIQRDGHIMNPYFGASMLHCGVFEEEDEGA